MPIGLLLSSCRDDGASDTASRSAVGSHAPGDTTGLPPRVVALRSEAGTFRFDPVGILLEPESDLHWLNMGDFHTTTAFHPEYDDLLAAGVPLRIPEEAEPWHSGMLGLTAGTQFTHRFTVEGVYDYFCQPHYSFGMVGRVVVGRPGSGPAVGNPLPETPPTLRENMPAVDEIVGPGGVVFEWSARINGVLFQAANGDDPARFATEVARGMKEHPALRDYLGERGRRLEEEMASFREAAVSGEGYETLVRRADAAKEILQASRGRG
ncbi:MAG: plastocyanin/azurin family copper-binding protein [Gemmatimonadota bacterium]|nr:plastocyanin/azurin family copper-binding protein [Gemmatimonadota bacterium]